MAVLLGHRLLVGAILGALVVRHGAGDDDDDATAMRYAQTSCLVALNAVLLLFVVVVRPFHIPAANLFEVIGLAAQTACLCLNFSILSRGGGGGKLDGPAADAAYHIMIGATV